MNLFTWKPQRLSATKTGIAACSMSAMVEPVATARGPRHVFSDFTPWIANAIAKVCLIITLLLAITGGAVTLAITGSGGRNESGRPNPGSGKTPNL